MTNPKVSEKEMLDWFDKLVVNSMFNLSKFPKRDKDILQAIRAAIEEGGRLREKTKEWREAARSLMTYRDRADILQERILIDDLLQELRDFTLDGEEKT